MGIKPGYYCGHSFEEVPPGVKKVSKVDAFSHRPEIPKLARIAPFREMPAHDSPIANATAKRKIARE